MPEPQKINKDALASAVTMIRTIDVHDAATAMAEHLKLNAEVRACVGKWDERGSIHGWTKVGKTQGPATVLVEVFVSDLAGEDREFDHYARRMEALIAENKELKARLEGASHDD